MAARTNTHERRAQIVDGLLTVMATTGYEGATIVAIGKAAGLTSGLVHYHFATKDEVLLALVEAGLTRDDAYRIVQENAGRAWDEGRSFRELLAADTRVTVPEAVLDDAFDLDRAVRHAGLGVDALDALHLG